MGRPCKLTPEIQAAIVARLSAGNYAEVAAASAGIHKATYYRWMARGRRAKRGQFRGFCDAIKRAEADAEVAHIGHIKRIAKGGAVTERRTVTRTDRQGQTTTEVIEKFSLPHWQAFA
jgi:hypothetical protein